MAYPNAHEHPNQIEVDVLDGEPLADSGFEDENSESDFTEKAEE
jgi:hypothetical protein